MTHYADYCGDLDDDHSGLLAWVDDDGRMFAVDAQGRVIEVDDDTDLTAIFAPVVSAVAAPSLPRVRVPEILPWRELTAGDWCFLALIAFALWAPPLALLAAQFCWGVLW